MATLTDAECAERLEKIRDATPSGERLGSPHWDDGKLHFKKPNRLWSIWHGGLDGDYWTNCPRCGADNTNHSGYGRHDTDTCTTCGSHNVGIDSVPEYM